MNKVYTVTQVNSYIKKLFVSDYVLSKVYIKGEVSNLKYHSSGHIYFSLKDPKGAMACVMFAGQRSSGLKFRMQDGQSVVAFGSVSVYERDGKYQLYANDIILDGAGVLYEEYERLKQKLYEEGLFDHDYKKEIVKNPKRVGIVTAKTGAAIQDIISIAKRRNPYVQLVLYNAKVQGDGAAQTIVKGIETLDQMNMDTIIIGRGGGSIEDLWAFNEEIVARAIFRAKTPIISGTGHETDNTIADYAADVRAATPSAACELAIPDYHITIDQLNYYQSGLQKALYQKLERARYTLEKYKLKMQYLGPANQLREKRMHLAELSDQMKAIMEKRIVKKRHLLELYTEKLNGLSPTRKLINGYGYVTNKKHKAISEIGQVKQGDEVKVTMLHGHFTASVLSVEEEKE